VSEVAKEEDVKLEDILKSIRGIIDDHNQKPILEPAASDSANVFQGDDAVLELTDIAHDDAHHQLNEELISAQAKDRIESQINEFVDRLENSNYQPLQEASLDASVNQLMRPLIKAWLDNNLPRVVERVVAEEIRKMIPKK
jgi:hypothetical protein